MAMAKTSGAAGAAMSEAPHGGDPLEQQVIGGQGIEARHAADSSAGGSDAGDLAAAEPASQPIVPEADQAMHFAGRGDRPGVNDASGATDEAIARRAYELYQARGGRDGADMEDWLQAERELTAGGELAGEREHRSHWSID